MRMGTAVAPLALAAGDTYGADVAGAEDGQREEGGKKGNEEMAPFSMSQVSCITSPRPG